MKINNNISAVIANHHLLRNENSLSKSMERLSSGYSLNHAKDNPSGMAISNKMRAQIRGLDRSSQNAQDGRSVLNTADGAIGEVTSILQRMRELSVQAANDTNTDTDRAAIQDEITNLRSEVDRISSTTEFNTKNLLDGSLDRKVYADNVSRVTASDEVSAGTYNLTVTQAATQAFTENSFTIPDELQNSGTVEFNGHSVTLEKGMKKEEVFEALRSNAEYGNLRLVSSTGQDATDATSADAAFYLQTTGYGEGATISVSGKDELLGELGLTSGMTNNGRNAEVSLGSASAFKDHPQATIKYDQNKITITDNGGFKMSMLLDAGYQSDISLEVTDKGPMDLQVGANTNQQMRVRIDAMDTKSLYIDDLDVTKMGGAARSISALDDAIAAVNENRSRIGAITNRLENTISNLDNASENMNDAISKLRDTDMASEMVEFTKDNVLQQAGTSALSQANELPQLALQLLQ